MELHRIVYHSRNTITEALARSMGDIGGIMGVSATNNAAAGVTGALMFSQDVFAQILEGPKAAVMETYARIETDPRHAGIVVIDSRTVTDRVFGDWSMAFVSPDRTVHPLILSRLNTTGDARATAAWLIKMLQDLVSKDAKPRPA